jgi:site-specific DNA-cytosine methylase
VFYVLKLLSSLSLAPRFVLLENVPGLLHQKCLPVLKDVCGILTSLGYVVKIWVMNSLESCIPHDRARVWILGMLSAIVTKQPAFPKKLKYLPSLAHGFLDVNGPLDEPGLKTHLTAREEYVADLVATTVARSGLDMNVHQVLVDVRSSTEFGTWHIDKVPCLTKDRAKSGGFWLLPRSSMLMVREMGRLMGLPQSVVETMLDTDADADVVAAAIGNAQSVNVLERILCAFLNMISRNTASGSEIGLLGRMSVII